MFGILTLLDIFMQTCYISQDYDDDLLECMGDSSQCQATVSFEQLDLPEGAHLK